jgi:hypothetical protein
MAKTKTAKPPVPPLPHERPEPRWPKLTPEAHRLVKSAPGLAAMIAERLVDLRGPIEAEEAWKFGGSLSIPDEHARRLYKLGWDTAYELNHMLWEILKALLGETWNSETEAKASELVRRIEDDKAAEWALHAEKLSGLDQQAGPTYPKPRRPKPPKPPVVGDVIVEDAPAF